MSYADLNFIQSHFGAALPAQGAMSLELACATESSLSVLFSMACLCGNTNDNGDRSAASLFLTTGGCYAYLYVSVTRGCLSA